MNTNINTIAINIFAIIFLSIAISLVGIGFIIHQCNDNIHITPSPDLVVARQVFRTETPSSKLAQLESVRKDVLLLKERVAKSMYKVNEELSKDDNTQEKIESLNKMKQDLFKQFDDINDILDDIDKQIKSIKNSI